MGMLLVAVLKVGCPKFMVRPFLDVVVGFSIRATTKSFRAPSYPEILRRKVSMEDRRLLISKDIVTAVTASRHERAP